MFKAIKTKTQYNKAVQRIYRLMQNDLKARLPEMDELEVLSILVEKYEEENYPIGPPDPIEAIKFRMEQLGLDQKDMVPYLGYPSRVSDILNGRRQLTVDMIKKLYEELNIPAEVLIKGNSGRRAKRISSRRKRARVHKGSNQLVNA